MVAAPARRRPQRGEGLGPGARRVVTGRATAILLTFQGRVSLSYIAQKGQEFSYKVYSGNLETNPQYIH